MTVRKTIQIIIITMGLKPKPSQYLGRVFLLRKGGDKCLEVTYLPILAKC